MKNVRFWFYTDTLVITICLHLRQKIFQNVDFSRSFKNFLFHKSREIRVKRTMNVEVDIKLFWTVRRTERCTVPKRAMVTLPRFWKSLNPGKTLTPISNAGVCQLDRHADGEENKNIRRHREKTSSTPAATVPYISYCKAILTSIVCLHEYTCFMCYT